MGCILEPESSVIINFRPNNMYNNVFQIVEVNAKAKIINSIWMLFDLPCYHLINGFYLSNSL